MKPKKHNLSLTPSGRGCEDYHIHSDWPNICPARPFQLSSITHQLLTHQKTTTPITTTYVSELTMNCYHTRLQVLHIGPVSLVLLLTTFSSFVKTIVVSIVINRCRYNFLSAKNEMVPFFLDTPKKYVPRNWWSSFFNYLPSSFYASPSPSFTFWLSSLQTLKTISTLQWSQAREVMCGRILSLA